MNAWARHRNSSRIEKPFFGGASRQAASFCSGQGSSVDDPRALRKVASNPSRAGLNGPNFIDNGVSAPRAICGIEKRWCTREQPATRVASRVALNKTGGCLIFINRCARRLGLCVRILQREQIFCCRPRNGGDFITAGIFAFPRLAASRRLPRAPVCRATAGVSTAAPPSRRCGATPRATAA